MFCASLDELRPVAIASLPQAAVCFLSAATCCWWCVAAAVRQLPIAHMFPRARFSSFHFPFAALCVFSLVVTLAVQQIDLIACTTRAFAPAVWHRPKHGNNNPLPRKTRTIYDGCTCGAPGPTMVCNRCQQHPSSPPPLLSSAGISGRVYSCEQVTLRLPPILRC